MCTYLRFCCCFPPNSRMLNLRHYFTKKKKFQFLHACLDSHSTKQLNGSLTLSSCSNPYSFPTSLWAHVQSHTDTRLWLPQIWRTELSSVLAPFPYILNSWWFCSSGSHWGLETLYNIFSFTFFSYNSSWRDGPAALLKIFEQKSGRLHAYKHFYLSTLPLYNSLSVLLQPHFFFPNFTKAF